MKRALRIAGLAGIMLLVSVCFVSADTLHYVVSGSLGSASFDLPQHPTVKSYNDDSVGNDFTVTVHNGSINLLGHSYPAPPFDLEFLNSPTGGFALVVPNWGDLQLNGAQMFTGSDSAPMLSMGTFLLDSGWVTVAVTDPASVPEPTAFILLGIGILTLFGVHLLRRVA